MISLLHSGSNNLDRYKNVNYQLQKLGYKHLIPSGSLPLLEEIIRDLQVLKEELKLYKQLIKKVDKEKLNLKKGLVPYQQDNGRLALENIDLQEKLFTLKQENEKEQREFERRSRQNKLRVEDLEFMYKITLEKVKELENSNKILSVAFKNLTIKNKDGTLKKIPTCVHIPELKEPVRDTKKNSNEVWQSKDEKTETSLNQTQQKMDRESAELLEELEELKLDNQHQSDIIAALKCQMTQKDREICRLRHALEGGRPLAAVARDCCHQCKLKESKINSLEEKLEEAVEKQHEAMSRALHLAEKNEHLERELKDIDHMALAVEEECHNKVKNNLRSLDAMEEKLHQKNAEIRKLEETILNMKKKIENNECELDSLRKEKEVLEKNLLTMTGEKKQLNDKINYFLIIEKNLKSEISRIQEINKSLERHICDMEERVIDILDTNCKGLLKEKQKKHFSVLGLPSSKSHLNCNTNDPAKGSKASKKCCDKEPDNCFHKNSSIFLLDKIQEERDFYHNECHRLKDQLGSLPCRNESSTELMKQIKELEREILDLKEENLVLRRENSANVKRLEWSEHLCSSGDSIKILLDRLEKERDMALSDISRLQGERDALKERIQLTKKSQIEEQSRFEKILRENEDRIRRLETERRELIACQSSQRISVANMEEKCDEYKESIRRTQNELAQMKANYNQLKALQEQTDCSLSEIQSRHAQAEIELRVASNKVQDLERIHANLQNELALTKKEKASLMSNLALVEKDKDGLLITLDEKTEKVAKLELHIKKQDAYVADLNEKISHLEQKFELTLNEKTNREYGFRSLEREVEKLKEELEQCEFQKEALIRENRRLQDDLSSAAKDCITARRELEMEKQDVENLKRQLQQYVTEESERNQMLEHFRSLSIEATTLETNNHSLESAVENTKTQLISANNKIMDLEHQMASKDSLLYSYEKQIAELTSQIAELESKLKQQIEVKMRAEDDLAALRDLCSTLDGQKEVLKRQANNSDAEKVHLMSEVRRLSEEYEGLTMKLTHERTLSQALEKSLSNSRQETLEHKITNKDLQTHVQHLKQKVDELTQKLESESKEVRRYQAQCAELSQQVSELRREVTNARFEHAKTKEDIRRNLTQSYHSDEDEKETFFQGISERNSARNIPPLDFPDDSDRTVSLDSESDHLRLLLDPGENENIFKRPFWKLSPLSEKYEEKTENDTASELSSLPEDIDAKNERYKTKNGSPSEEKTDLSAYPTYSLRNKLGTEDEVPDTDKTNTPRNNSGLLCSETKTGIYFSEFFSTRNRCQSDKSDFSKEEKNDESCSECGFHKSFLSVNSSLENENGPTGRHHSANLSGVLSPSSRVAVSLEEYHSSKSCGNENVDCLGNIAGSEIDENTFSFKKN